MPFMRSGSLMLIKLQSQSSTILQAAWEAPNACTSALIGCRSITCTSLLPKTVSWNSIISTSAKACMPPGRNSTMSASNQPLSVSTSMDCVMVPTKKQSWSISLFCTRARELHTKESMPQHGKSCCIWCPSRKCISSAGGFMVSVLPSARMHRNRWT